MNTEQIKAPSLHIATGRHATFEQYRDAAELIYPGLGAWTYDKFNYLNKRHFDNRIPLLPIRWHRTLPYGNAVGLAAQSDHIDLGMYVNSQWNLRNKKPCLFGEHVLLHEMIHVYLFLINQPNKHNTEAWCRQIERIGVELGMRAFTANPSKVVKVKNEDGTRRSQRRQTGDLSRVKIATFPHFAFDYESETILNDYR